MMGDGQKSYDHATDGANHEIAACSVSARESDLVVGWGAGLGGGSAMEAMEKREGRRMLT